MYVVGVELTFAVSGLKEWQGSLWMSQEELRMSASVGSLESTFGSVR